VSKTNTVAPKPPTIKLVFYTTGDTGLVTGTSTTGSDWFRNRATTLATSGYVYGATSTADATSYLGRLPATVTIGELYFVGHGNETGFFFACTPDPTYEYVGDDSQVLNDPASSADALAFFNELAKHLAAGGFKIGFLACRCGKTLVGAVKTALSHKSLNHGNVGGYTNVYQTWFDDPSQTWTDRVMDEATEKTMLRQASHNGIPAYDTNLPITP
jgi:hypothetical protein